MVLKTNPDQPINDLINGWYDDQGIPGPDRLLEVQDVDFILPGYRRDFNRPFLYGVYKPYCQTCHIAQTNVPLLSPRESFWAVAKRRVFQEHVMPQAERTAHNLWTSITALSDLAESLDFAIRVTSLGNEDSGPNRCASISFPCTLREAIRKANETPGRDIITFITNGTFDINQARGNPPEDDDAIAGDLDIRDDLTILGNGADKTIIDANGFERVFHILDGADVVIQGVTIQNGSTDDLFGPAIGGGIFVTGKNTSGKPSKLTLNHSVLKNNRAGAIGGALYVDVETTAEINQSTIGEGNDSASGGGISNSGVLILNNSTVSGNTARNAAAGISSGGDGVKADIFHSTITGNVTRPSTVAAGGIDNSVQGRVTLRNSIVAGNTNAAGPQDCRSDSTSEFVSLGYNLVGQSGNANGCPVDGTTDKMLAKAISDAIDTNLQGSPPFHALVFGSEAIDAIPRQPFPTLDPSCTPPSYDQRNVARPLDGKSSGDARCDIGAIELVPADLSISLVDPPAQVTAGNNLTFTLDVRNNGPNDATGVTVTGMPSTPPAGVTFVSATASQGTCGRRDSAVACNLGNLASGANASITIIVRPTTPGFIRNTASVSANESDPDSTNNRVEVETAVNPAARFADLSISAESPAAVTAGNNLTFALNVRNNGPNNATGVIVRGMPSTTSAGVQFISATPSSCVRTGSVVNCNLGNLASGTNASVRITLRPTAPGILRNTANVSANELDPDDANNAALRQTTVR